MGFLLRFFRWLASLFRRGPLTRDVARLGTGAGESADGRAPDVSKEVIVTSGPLKPGHRRAILRDPRLLPKPPTRLPLGQRPKLLSKDDARRLFSNTLRSRNRNLFDLLPDVSQLERYGLPIWRSEADVATALGISVKTLRHYSVHRSKDKARHYVSFAIPKRSGGERVIQAPKKRLKQIQRDLLARLVEKLPVSEHAHGFVPERSIRTNAEPHVGHGVVIRLDLKDFFPSVTYRRVRGLLIALGYGYPVAATLAVLMTEAERQPVVIDGERYFVPVGPRVCVQGAPTSPGLCNAVVHKLDRRLAGLARKHGFVYTRYADDLTFSGDDTSKVELLVARARQVVHGEGFVVNDDKTRIQRAGRAQRVTGVTVNQVLGLSRKERRKIRAMIHREQKDPSLKPRNDGMLAFVEMLNEEQAQKLRTRRS